MGQVHIASVHAGQLPDLVAALGQAGFDIAGGPVDSREQRQYRCRRGDREVVLGISPGRQGASEVLVVLAHPPYAPWPWRWGADGRFFGDITDVLDRFHYLD